MTELDDATAWREADRKRADAEVTRMIREGWRVLFDASPWRVAIEEMWPGEHRRFYWACIVYQRADGQETRYGSGDYRRWWIRSPHPDLPLLALTDTIARSYTVPQDRRAIVRECLERIDEIAALWTLGQMTGRRTHNPAITLPSESTVERILR